MEKSKRSRLFGDRHLGKMGFWDMAIFVVSLEAKIVNFPFLLCSTFACFIEKNIKFTQNGELYLSQNVFIGYQ